MDSVKRDPRFSHITKDPKFRQMKSQHRKVKIDDRFKGMFKDKSFKLKYSVDKRGRPIQATTNEDLRRFYSLDDSEDEDIKNTEKKNKDSHSSKTASQSKNVQLTSDDRFQQEFSSGEYNMRLYLYFALLLRHLHTYFNR